MSPEFVTLKVIGPLAAVAADTSQLESVPVTVRSVAASPAPAFGTHPAQGNVVLVLAEAGKTVSAENADYVWYTAAQPEQDHCAQLRQ